MYGFYLILIEPVRDEIRTFSSQMTFLRQRTNKNITENRKNKSFQNNTYINSTD